MTTKPTKPTPDGDQTERRPVQADTAELEQRVDALQAELEDSGNRYLRLRRAQPPLFLLFCAQATIPSL